MTGCRRQSAITRNQWRTDFLGERDVSRIIRRQIVTELPNAGQQNEVRIAGHAYVEQVVDSPVSKVRWDSSVAHQTPQYLSYFNIQEMGSVQGFVT